MESHTIGAAQFAHSIGVCPQTVYRYLNGERVPGRAVLARIKQVTAGAVLPNDFHQFVVAERCACEPRA